MLSGTKKTFSLLAVFITVIIVASSCKKSNNPVPSGPVTNTEINTWIKDSLNRYYYWADNLPANTNTNQEPLAYFNSVKNKADRFSYIMLPGSGSSLTATSRSKYGFDYVVINEPVTNRVLGIITLVLNTSPAKGSGLRRGQYFTKVNDTQLTETNIDVLKNAIVSQASTKLTLAAIDGDKVKETGSANVIAGETLEQTAVQNTFTEGGKKIGYLFFTGFSAAERQSYLTVFADYKAAGVIEFILDLRYNAGGDVSAAAAMCSMLASGITAQSPFIEYRGNKNGGIRKESFATAAEAESGPSFATLQQHNLNLSRLYILTTAATASAAELMINNLRPYMSIIHIGETTRGKDEASITISDKRSNKRIDWVMYPIVYKLYNATGNGNYANGIVPDRLMIESANLPLQSFGNAADPMINYAIGLINGNATLSSKRSISSLNTTQTQLYNSATLFADNAPLITAH